MRRLIATFLVAVALASAGPMTAWADGPPTPTSDTLLPPVNAARAAAGAGPLTVDFRLEVVASIRSKQLVRTHLLTHCGNMVVPPEGQSCPDLAAAFQLDIALGIPLAYAENLAALGPADVNSVSGRQRAFNAWMGSELHRENILNPDLHHMGSAEARWTGVVGGVVWTPSRRPVVYVQEFSS